MNRKGTDTAGRLLQEAEAAQEVLVARVGIQGPEGAIHPQVRQVTVALLVPLLQPLDDAVMSC